MLSAIGDEECSLTSEIFDKQQENQELGRPLQLGDIIQVHYKQVPLRNGQKDNELRNLVKMLLELPNKPYK